MKSLVEKINRDQSWGWLPAQAEHVIESGITIQQIPAPTFSEKARAAYLAEQFRNFDLQAVEIDELHNVYGLLPGKNRPGLMISAHTDTVFDPKTVLQIRRENGLIYGP